MAGRALERIESLDPIRDHVEITYLSTRFDFPFDTVRALELALFRTFAVPSISTLLDRTGEFEKRAQKRYDDTDIIVSELVENGYESERGKAALRRMNQLHGRFAIANEDFLYVLSTFVFEPIRWNARFGWRRLTEKENAALFEFWRQVGRRMNIREIPETLEAFERWSVEFERARFRFSDANRRVGTATRNLFLSWFPRALHPFAERSLYALMDEPLLEAFGFPKPSRLERALIESTLRSRASVLRFLPRRRRPYLRTQRPTASYPHDYRIEELGPEAS